MSKPTSRRLIDQWTLGIQNRPSVESDLTYEDLTTLQSEVNSIAIDDEFLDRFSQVIDLLSSRGILISDRRRVQILKFMRGWAIIQGDDTLYAEHLHRALVHIVYQTVDDIAVIKEVLLQAVPTAEKQLADMRRAYNAILTEYHSIHSSDSKNIGDLNRVVGKLRKQHSDIGVLSSKLEEILESGSYRIGPATRKEATKLSQQLDQAQINIAKSISDFTP